MHNEGLILIGLLVFAVMIGGGLGISGGLSLGGFGGTGYVGYGYSPNAWLAPNNAAWD